MLNIEDEIKVKRLGNDTTADKVLQMDPRLSKFVASEY